MQGEQGIQGIQGVSVTSITKTGTVGLVDTYTITLSNGQTTTFTVTNGRDGEGSGDMNSSDYDSDLSVKNAGGIADYVDANGGKIDHIQVNGTEQTITNKTVNVLVPKKVIL